MYVCTSGTPVLANPAGFEPRMPHVSNSGPCAVVPSHIARCKFACYVWCKFCLRTAKMPRRDNQGGGRRSVEITPELCEQLLSMDPNEAVAELQDQGLSQAEARDVVMQLRQEAGVTAELANTLLGLPPHEAVELLMQTPGIQEGGMTANEPVERAV